MKKSFLKNGYTEIEKHFDEKQEVVDVIINTHKYLANTKEGFWLMYSSMVLILKSSQDVRMKLFASLLERYGRGQEFSMSKTLKEIIARECECSPRSFDTAFSSLVKDNIIAKIGSRLYTVNPRHVFQGNTTARNQALKAVIELGCKEC